MDTAKLQEQVRAYWENWQELNMIYEEYARSLGLSYTSLKILSIITSSQEDCTQKTICQKSFLPKQTVNTVITSFLKQGFIRLAELPSDRRTKVILLTEEGKAYTDKVISKIRRVEYRAMEQLNEEERIALLESTRLYAEGCQKFMKEEN